MTQVTRHYGERVSEWGGKYLPTSSITSIIGLLATNLIWTCSLFALPNHLLQIQIKIITEDTMRPPQACYGCRQSKRKCTRRHGQVGDPCDQCQGRGLKCAGSLKNAHRRPRQMLLMPSPTETLALDDDDDRTKDAQGHDQVPLNVAVRLVDYYLVKLHNCPHSLFHPDTLRAQVRRRSISQALLLAICSMGSRFDEDARIRGFENRYMADSKRLLLADLENICIENVQTCILLANLSAAHLNPSSEALFFRTCCRFSFL